MKLNYKPIIFAAIVSTLLFVTTVMISTLYVAENEAHQFKTYSRLLKNVNQRLILLGLLTESQLKNYELTNVDQVQLETVLSFQDMIVQEKADEDLGLITAVGRKAMHDTEMYINHRYEDRKYFIYFRSFTDNTFVLENIVEGVDRTNIGFDMEQCKKYDYCVQSAWKAQLIDRLYYSKPFNSVLTGSRAISVMSPVYYNNNLVGEFAAVIDLSVLEEDGRSFTTRINDGHRNLEVGFPGYPFERLVWNESVVVDNFNVLVVKYPLSKVPIDFAPLWFVFFFISIFYFDKAFVAKERKELLDRALTNVSLDELTGLYNRKVFSDDTFKTRLNNAPYSVIAIDGNRIKLINDKYGHHVGDDAIVIIAEAMKKVFRNSDYLVRTGGDEFLAILPGCSLSQASVLSKKLQDTVKDNRLKSLDIEISVSTGLATGDNQESIEDVMIRADEDLYEMKKQRD